MIKLVGTMVGIFVVVALFAGFIFQTGKEHPLAPYKQVNETGSFNSITKVSYSDYDVYSLYIKEENDQITEKEFVIYTSKYAMKGDVTLNITNTDLKNTYKFDYSINGWETYDNNHKNIITLNINNKTTIKEIIN